MDNGKQAAQRADQSNTGKNLSSNVHAINAVKNEPALTIQRAAFAPELLPPGDLPVVQQACGNQVLQRMLVSNDAHDAAIAKPKENRTGMPDQLKAGLECLSGLDLANVRVNYNSDLPHQVGALAYTRGTDIYVAPGQEQHLPHEGWHVVQQMQGRVSPNFQMKGMGINDDAGLEREAEEMGARARETEGENNVLPLVPINRNPDSEPIQRITIKIEGQDDQTDFTGTEGLLAQYLGETPVSLAEVDLTATDNLNIWGHMTSETIGELTFEQLAGQLIAKGYRGCDQIRLIGCNDFSNPIEAPKRLWNALYQQLSQIILEGHKPVMPPIYATKGRLHTGGSKLPPESHWYIVTELLQGESKIINQYCLEYKEADRILEKKTKKLEREAMEFVQKLMEKFAEQSAKGEAPQSLEELAKKAAITLAKESGGEYKKEYAVALAEILIREFPDEFIKESNPDIKGMANSIFKKWIGESSLYTKHDSRVEIAAKEKKESIRKLGDKIQKASGKYHSIFRRNAQQQWEWNPDAWVCYDGKSE